VVWGALVDLGVFFSMIIFRSLKIIPEGNSSWGSKLTRGVIDVSTFLTTTKNCKLTGTVIS
jgi:hypothetical protein